MSEAKIDVSVIIPCYNDDQYLEAAIASVRLEENPTTEIVIIDDGSDENATPILRKMAQSERLRIFFCPHRGPAETRNEGIRQARGRYILPLDADDLIDGARYIPGAMRLLEEHPEYGVVYCHADLCGEESGKWALPDYSFDRMLVQNLVFVTAMFRKSDWEAVGGYSAELVHGMEDYDFFISMLALGKEIYQMPETYFTYRIRKKSRTTAFLEGAERQKEAFAAIYARHTDFYRANGDRYARLLRDEVIQLQYEKQMMAQANEMLDKIKRIPLVSWAAKKIFRK